MIVRLMGGLGNQMFQYAFGASVAQARHEKLWFSNQYLGGRAYGLHAFQAQVEFTPETSSLYREAGFSFDSHALRAPHPNTTFVGYWQTEKYFDTVLVRHAFTLRNTPSQRSLGVAEDINRARPSAFIHIRRGDYLTPTTAAYHGSPSMEYYRAGMQHLRAAYPDTRFFVFSDDPEWCRANFEDCVVVDHNLTAPHEDLWLMSQCNHAVLANSSFSWWGAWLGDLQPNRIVLTPQRWFAADINTSDLVPERWVKL